MKIIGTILKTLVILAMVLFGALNMQKVNITYFYGDEYVIAVPMFVAILAALFTGLIVAGLLTVKERMKLKKDMKKLKKQMADTEAELKRLRNLPLTEEVVSKEVTPVEAASE